MTTDRVHEARDDGGNGPPPPIGIRREPSSVSSRRGRLGGFEPWIRVLLDVAAGFAGFWVAFYLFEVEPFFGLAEKLPPARDFLVLSLWYCLVLLLLFTDLGLYRRHATLLNIGELKKVVRGSMFAAAILVATLFFKGAPPYSRSLTVASLVIATAAVTVERRILASLLRGLRLQRQAGRKVLIYGAGDTGQRLMKKIVQAPHLGATLIGFVDDFAPLGKTYRCRISQTDPTWAEARVLGRLEDIPRIVSEREVDELLLAIPHRSYDKVGDLVDSLRELGIAIGLVPRLSNIRVEQLQVEELGGIPVLRPHDGGHRYLFSLAKRGFDVVAACLLIPLFVPFWVVVAVLIRLESPGSPIFRQRRVGLRGEEFDLYKLRTMYRDVPEYETSPTSNRDARITRVGRLVRTVGFDETPQLINVLKGDMSLVGPRPEMPFIVQRYSSFEHQRLQVKPGMTGLWQLSSDRDAEIHRHIEYDLYYIQYRSFSLDLAILLETLFFTGGLILSRMWNRSEGRSPAAELASPQTREGFVLAALDQRLRNGVPESWKRAVPPLCSVIRDVPVKILVADGNVQRMDDLFRETIGEIWNEDGFSAEYVPYEGRSALERLVRRAAAVLTDLPQAKRWAEQGLEVLVLDRDGEVRWHRAPEDPPPIGEVLYSRLTGKS